MDFKIRKMRTKIFTGSPSDVESQVNDFLNSLDQLNYVDMKVANMDKEKISVVVVYKIVQNLKQN